MSANEPRIPTLAELRAANDLTGSRVADVLFAKPSPQPGDNLPMPNVDTKRKSA